MTTRLGALPIAALLVASLAAPAAATTVIRGTSGDDVLVGTARADTIRGLGGADRIYGKAGPDHLYGGKDRKKDFLYGGRGNDRIVIRRRDHVYAGPGNDVIVRPDNSGMYLLYVWCGTGYDKVIANAWLIGGGNDCEEWE